MPEENGKELSTEIEEERYSQFCLTNLAKFIFYLN